MKPIKKRNPKKPCITVCAGTGCCASGSEEVIAAFKSEIKSKKLDKKVSVRATGCHGFCEKGPVVVIYPERI